MCRNSIPIKTVLVLLVFWQLIAGCSDSGRKSNDEFEVEIARLEKSGGIPSRLEACPVDGITNPMREAFISEELPHDLADRVAAMLLAPEVKASEYVSRNGPGGVTVKINRNHMSWETVHVVAATLILPGTILLEHHAIPPPVPMMLAGPDELATVPAGMSEVELRIEAWIFDQVALDSYCRADSGGGSLLNPLGWDPFLYGGDSLQWEQFWPELASSGLAVWHGKLEGKPVAVEFVDSLPKEFPRTVTDHYADSVIDSILVIDNLRFSGHNRYEVWTLLYYTVRCSGVLPLPVAGRLTVATESDVPIMGIPIVLDESSKGTKYTSGYAMDHGVSGSALSDWMRGFSSGDTTTVSVSVVPSRRVAASVPGLNSFWGGNLHRSVRVVFE